jgi:hypothetical protein
LEQLREWDAKWAEQCLEIATNPWRSSELPLKTVELSGHVPLDVGTQIIAALAHQSKVIEIDELTRRIEALERSKYKQLDELPVR